MRKAVDNMNFETAAALMMAGSGGGGGSDVVELPKPDTVEYADLGAYDGQITEHYNVGKEDEYSLKIRINFGNKGTPNEQVYTLYFYDKDGYQTDSISFSGFYVG